MEVLELVKLGSTDLEVSTLCLGGNVFGWTVDKPASHRLLDRLVESGKSVIVIEHHQAVMAHADWIIDLGPGAGSEGGRVVFEGTPAALVADASTLTGKHLKEYIAG